MPNIPASVSAVSAPADNLQESKRFIVSLYVIIIIFRVSSKSRYFLFLPTAVSVIASLSYFEEILRILHYSQSSQQNYLLIPVVFFATIKPPYFFHIFLS